MTESSLTRLADYLAGAVASKFARMTETEFSFLHCQAQAYEQIWAAKELLYEAMENGQEVDEIYFNIICNTVEADLMKLASHLNNDELHMECAHAQPVSDTEPFNILLCISSRLVR